MRLVFLFFSQNMSTFFFPFCVFLFRATISSQFFWRILLPRRRFRVVRFRGHQQTSLVKRIHARKRALDGTDKRFGQRRVRNGSHRAHLHRRRRRENWRRDFTLSRVLDDEDDARVVVLRRKESGAPIAIDTYYRCRKYTTK